MTSMPKQGGPGGLPGSGWRAQPASRVIYTKKTAVNHGKPAEACGVRPSTREVGCTWSHSLSAICSPNTPPKCPDRCTYIMHIIITGSGLSIGNLCSQQFLKDDNSWFLHPCYWQGSAKASSPLNGYVAVFAIVGDRSSAHDQL